MRLVRDYGLLATSPQSPPDTILCLSHLRWNFVYQRPQHLLSRAASTYRVLFVEEPVFEESVVPRLDVLDSPEGVSVAVPKLPVSTSRLKAGLVLRELIDQLVIGVDASRLVLWYYTPMALPFTRHLRRRVCAYDNMDELSAFKGASPRLIVRERELFRTADVVFTGGFSLFEAKRSMHHNIYPFPSGIDVSHFVRARDCTVIDDPADQLDLPHPRLGFFGVIDERINLHLIARIADLRPNWQLVMLGPVAKIDPGSLPQRSNLKWLGPKSYQDLPAYLARWDVGIMPFAINEATRFISPTKTPEFLAAGVPVISTPIRDVVRAYGAAGLVAIAETAEDFVERAASLMARPRATWLSTADEYLSSISWDQTWKAMDAYLRDARQSVHNEPSGRTAQVAGVAAHV